MSDNIEQTLIDNWELFLGLVNRIEHPEVKKGLLDFCDHYDTRIMTSPAATKTEYNGAFAGGLVWHSLNVLKYMKELNKVYGSACSVDDMIVVALFHDIGKIGNREHDYYNAQESDWHRNKGFMFEVHPELVKTPVIARTFWWLSTYKIPMSENVVEALFSLYTSNTNNRVNELYNVNDLGLLLQQAVRASCIKNKGVNSL